jgi:hypothetical protein
LYNTKDKKGKKKEETAIKTRLSLSKVVLHKCMQLPCSLPSRSTISISHAIGMIGSGDEKTKMSKEKEAKNTHPIRSKEHAGSAKTRQIPQAVCPFKSGRRKRKRKACR